MKKYRYIPESDLQPEASDEIIDFILTSISTGEIRIMGGAKRYVEGPWQMDIPQFVEAIQAHLENGNRLFEKRIVNPPDNTEFFEANVGLDPEGDDEEEDVYVEIRVVNNQVVIVCDAHSHHQQPRLPK